MIDSDRHVVLADINALLDTRLGTIAMFDEKIALRLSQDPKYINRHYDHFEELVDHPDFKHSDYEETYQKQNEITLAHSRPTPMLIQLPAIMAGYVADCIENPDKNYVDLHINVSPYNDLSPETCEDIKAAVAVGMSEQVNIKIVRLPISALTPGQLKSNYTHWITYDYGRWFEWHFGSRTELTEKELRDYPMPRFTIYAPMRFRSKEAYEEYRALVAAKPDQEKQLNPFVSMYFMVYTFFGLEYRPISEFSILSKAADL